jgi:hypothetical protein
MGRRQRELARGPNVHQRVEGANENRRLIRLPFYASWLHRIEIYFSILQPVGAGDERAGEPGGALVDADKARVQPLGGAGVSVLDGGRIEPAIAVRLAKLGAQMCSTQGAPCTCSTSSTTCWR